MPKLKPDDFFSTSKQVYYLHQPKEAPAFEAAYIAVRKAEQRIYDDAVVRHLPRIDASHPLAREWAIRENTLKKFRHHLQRSRRFRTLLDIGCGNGWMSHHISTVKNCRVIGLDLNRPELEQAVRVFGTSEKLTFVYGDILRDDFPAAGLDVILLASSIQYFPDVSLLLDRLLSLLKPGGEIHILDSPFYASAEIPAAQERSRQYYQEMGYPEMAGQYFHHSRESLTAYNPKLLHQPGTIAARVRQRIKGTPESPFPWFYIWKS